MHLEDEATASGRTPGTAPTMSAGRSIAQCSVDPDRRTTALTTWSRMPNRLKASNCNSPESKCSTTRRSSASPVRFGEVHRQAFADQQRGTVRGHADIQAGSVTAAGTIV